MKIYLSKLKIYILILVIAVLPGIYVAGNLVWITDILIPYMFFRELLKRRHVMIVIRTPVENIVLACYIMICFLSIVLACIRESMFYTYAFFRFLRLLYFLMVIYIINKNLIRKDTAGKCMDAIMVSGCLTGALGIYLFFHQNVLYHAAQTMIFNGRLLYRAGGVFAEAGTFSFMMAILMLMGIQYLQGKRKKTLAIAAIMIAAVAIVLADTRAAIFAVCIASVFVILKYPDKMGRALLLGLLAVFLIWMFYQNNGFVHRFINDRLAPFFYIFTSHAPSDINGVSSGRIAIWQRILENFSKGSFVTKLFGTGYKKDFFDITDNNFLGALYTTGILGAFFLVGYWLAMLDKTFLKKKRRAGWHRSVRLHRSGWRYQSGVLTRTSLCLVVATIVFMMTSDAMTMSRPMYIIMIVFTLKHKQSIQKKSIKPPQIKRERPLYGRDDRRWKKYRLL